MKILRLLYILYTLQRYGLHQLLNRKNKFTKLTLLVIIIRCCFCFIPSKNKQHSLALRTRLALEQLGPIFIKFGQLLSTRQDLIPEEYIFQLSKLQNQVKPFAGNIAKVIVTAELKVNNLEEIFSSFSAEAVASASIAQVHKAQLKSTGELVAVKILRPNIANIIKKDLALLLLLAKIIAKFHPDGKRLKPPEVIAQFKKIIYNEIDFLQEAANCSELQRLHQNDSSIIIPKVFYQYTSSKVITFQWMDGIAINDLTALKVANIDLVKLSHLGVTIFYTQVFNFGFFHADMHPGNILCSNDNRYIALDFGIVGALSDDDKRYLAINLLAFFNRDYKKVAQTHIESGWAPPNTDIEDLAAAVRAVCAPIFNKPLAEISFAQVLLRLFQISRQFDITIQPQLILLQKTIVNIEGLGRLLNPQLDLWVTAKPILEKWLNQQIGIRGFWQNLQHELPYLAAHLPKMPRLYLEKLQASHLQDTTLTNYKKLLKHYHQQNYILLGILITIVTAVIIHYIF